MKHTKISINGQLVSEVRTRAIPDYPTNSISYIGHGNILVQDDDGGGGGGGGLMVTLNPMTVAQLYYDGVLPQDRSIPIKVKVGRRKVRTYVVESLRTRKDRWSRHTLVLRLEPA